MRRDRFRISPPRAAAAVVVGAALLLSGCSADDSAGAPGGDVAAADDLGVDGDDPMAPPQECLDAEIPSLGPAELSDVGMLPAGWPDAPEGSVLCVTADTANGAQESATFATPLSRDEVYAAYAEVMPSAWGAAVETDGGGTDVLVGEADGTWFQVKAHDQQFTVTFAAP